MKRDRHEFGCPFLLYCTEMWYTDRCIFAIGITNKRKEKNMGFLIALTLFRDVLGELFGHPFFKNR